MTIPVIMPQLGESVAEGTVIEWLKHEGDRVKKDEGILAISTDKVDAEIPAPAGGVLSRILVKAGEAAPVGATLAIITEGFVSGTGIDVGGEEVVTVSASRTSIEEPRALPAVAEQAGESREPRRTKQGERFYSPAVRTLAEGYGINLDEVPGTGEGGRVTRQDVELFAQTRGARPEPPDVAHPPKPGPAQGSLGVSDGEQLLPLTKIRRTIAERMVRSKQLSPHVTSVAEADFTAIARFRETKKAAFRRAKGINLTFLPFILKATASVLPEFPMLNSRWTDEGIRLRKAIHLGVAVGLPDGLIVPVIRDAGSKSLSELALAVAELVRRAEEGRLPPEGLTGSTFTVNNFGADGNLIGTPILNQPEVGNLGVGTIEKRPVVVSRDGEDVIAIRWRGYLCLSYDHRVVDGATAGRFLQALNRTLGSFSFGEGIWADSFLRTLG
jgi:pyruvate/2-oxoglutarate dehydrogenase complex dihydrolipoamide acyltransferase (E2) component